MLPLAAALALAMALPAQGLKVSRLMAPPSACPNQRDADAPVGVQERAMRCHDQLRPQSAPGAAASVTVPEARPLRGHEVPSTSSAATVFSHFRLRGRDFTYWMQPGRATSGPELLARRREHRLGQRQRHTPRPASDLPRLAALQPAHREPTSSAARFDQIGTGLRDRSDAWADSLAGPRLDPALRRPLLAPKRPAARR